MRDYKELDIAKEDLEFISSDKSYIAKFEQIDYNLVRITSVGFLTLEHAISIEKIISNILIKFEDLHTKQKIYFLNDITQLKRPKLQAVNYIFSRIKSYNNLGGILVVGNNPVIKIALSASSHFIKGFLLKFYTVEQDAIDYYKAHLSVNIGFVQEYFERIDDKYVITLEFEDSPTKFYMEFDGDDIITNKPLGTADANSILKAFEKFDNEIYPEILNGKMYYRVHDFTNYETTSGNASSVFIKWLKQHFHEMHLVIFCGLSKKSSVLIKLGRLLFKEKHKILIVDTLEDAYTAIYRHKNKLKSITESNTKNDYPLPESKEELQELVEYLLQENKEIKGIITNSSERLFNLLSEMTWPKERLQELDFEREKIPEPFENLVETIRVIYDDLQDLIRSRNEEHKKSKLLEERYRKIMQVMPKVAIRGYNKDLTISFWNNAGKEIFDISPEEAIGKNLKDIYICQNCVDLVEDAVNKAIESKITGEFLKSSHQILNDKNGKKIVVYSIHTTLFDNQGDQIFFSLDFDLTKQFQIEEELRNHKENLEELVKEKTSELEVEKNKAQESDRLKTAFLANMSHEIRSPMNTIIGFSELLENEDLSIEKQNKFINLIKTSSNNLLNIINDIVDISKIEAGQISIKKEDFTLCEIFEYLNKEYLPEIEKLSEVSFRFKSCESEKKIIINSDLLRIKQILTNLISNAIKFTHKGFIEVSYEITQTNKIHIYVKDTGIGLEKEQIKYIFNRFRQADEKITKEYGGTGLGLTISKYLAELLDGNILVESELGKGSKFILELPYQDLVSGSISHNEKNISDNKINAISNLINKNILLVEDDLSSALLMIELLERKGINVIHADRGFKAIKQFNTNKNIDLVLLDIQLPDIDGYEIFNRIRGIDKTIPIIAQTAFALLNEREKILDFGFNDYLSKPIRHNELYSTLEQYLISNIE